VNNGSTDNTEEILEKFKQQFFRPMVIVNESKPGLGRARNAGWKKARGNVIVFTDDDCYPAQDYFDRILECFENDDIYFIGGRILLYDPEDLPLTIQVFDRRKELYPGDFISAGLIQGANFAFRRLALINVDGFEETMGAGTPFACEDVEILARLLRNGYRGAYDPRPLIYHHHRRKTEAEAIKLSKSYDYGRGAYYAKCILDNKLRYLYAKHWYWSIRSKPRERSVREIKGAIHFILNKCFSLMH
jgi:glycosyltransferase involved in cell wall biosynthesis